MSDKCGIRLTKCFWCREPDGIAIPKDISKLSNDSCPPICVSYDPCEKCIKNFKEGVLLMEASPVPLQEGHVALIDGAYLTGRHWVVREGVIKDAAKGESRLVTEEDAKEMGLYEDG